MLGVLVAIKTAEYVRKAKKYADPNGPHADVVNSAKTKIAQCRNGMARCIDGAGQFVDEQTGGKYADKINSGVGKAKDLLADDSQDGTGPVAAPDGPPEEPQGPTQPTDGPRPDAGGSAPGQPPQA